MLYNMKWGTAPTLEGFIEWLEAQPADAVYNYGEAEHCAAGRYYKSIGLTPKQFICGPPDSIAVDLGCQNNEVAVAQALYTEPRTFGDAAHRLRKLRVDLNAL